MGVISIDGDKVYVCSTSYVTLYKIVTDEEGRLYKVIDFKFNEWLCLENIDHSHQFDGSVLYANPITFLHGSPSSVNNEYALIDNRTLNKTPFVWLLETYEYDDLPIDSSIEKLFNSRVFLMDWANTPKWLNQDHNEFCIKPMENLKDLIKSVINEDYAFRNLSVISSRVRSRFGVEVTNKGSSKTIINEDLSGLDVSLKIEVYDLSTCCIKN